MVSWTDVDGAGPPLELTSLYVGAGERGRGVGHQLLAYAIGQRDASLWVFTQNVRAQQLYARVGFTASGASRTDPDTGLGE